MRIRYVIQIALLLAVWCLMLIPQGGEWYAQTVYPILSGGLSYFSSLFPFSLGDLFIYGSIIGLLLYALITFIHRKGIRRMLRQEIEYLVWIYIGFYLTWGLNYYRDDFYTRTHLLHQSYSEEHFKKFLVKYTDSLNGTYCQPIALPTKLVDKEVKAVYRDLAAKYKLVPPHDFQQAKPMLFSPLMSAVGVSGYIGPFFIEYNLNKDLLPVQYPATYAHELAHVLGIANEAEANFYSYQVCIRSSVQEIRFSGYFSLFPYVLSNAHRFLSIEDYQMWVDSLRPEIKQLYQEEIAHWQALYNPTIGEWQEILYNMYLKGNRISSGTANYSEVIALIMAEETARK